MNPDSLVQRNDREEKKKNNQTFHIQGIGLQNWGQILLTLMLAIFWYALVHKSIRWDYFPSVSYYNSFCAKHANVLWYMIS